MAASAYGHHASSSVPHHGYAIPPSAPPGTFPPGTMITVGAHQCTIERYLSEGGFAHVYLVRLTRPVNGSDIVVLKRVAVPDKEALANMRTEVETMKRLKGHKHIVTYIDSHASHLKGGGYEVFLLMEYCSGGGLIDFMNTRLQNRLTEPEVITIISDVAEGVACMHYLQPPLLHRDLKVENVLIANPRRFVLCDFGSCSPVKAATTLAECRLLEEDIQKHTTLQYRSPEMVDVYKKIPIDEKSDIWALGVLLYKLCYYTTPFEEKGQLAIMNASFKFPSYPAFSDRLKSLIASMLREVAHTRPNIYQVLRELCSMQGKEAPIKDIYHGRTTQIRTDRPVPATTQAPSIIAYQAPVVQTAPVVPDIVPMRRGRPTKSAPVGGGTGLVASSQSRAVSSDPFAALDNQTILASAQDELSARFPSVEQFSLLHDSGNKFDFKEFNPDSPSALPAAAPAKDLNTRVMERLADDAFANPSGVSQRSSPVETKPRDYSDDRQRAPLYQPQPQRPTVVSTGTMTSPTHSPCPSPDKLNMRIPEASSRPHSRPQSRSLDHLRSQPPPATAPAVSTTSKTTRPVYLEAHRSSTHSAPRTTTSSRPSLESHRPASSNDIFAAGMARSKTQQPAKARPTSVYIESNLDFLRDLDSPAREKETTPPATSTLPIPNRVIQDLTGQSISSQRSDHIESNVEFLRAMENESDIAKGGGSKRLSTSGQFVGKHIKRSSMPSISLSNTKTLLAGKFGDAFRRFEGNAPADGQRTPSPLNDSFLGPIAGSGPASEISDEPTGSQPHHHHKYQNQYQKDWEVSSEVGDELSPEAKREIEKRMLIQEEERVAAAAARYKKEVANRSAGDSAGGAPPRQLTSSNRASTIQNKVKALLSENRAPTPRTAEGYGIYTDDLAYQQHQHSASRDIKTGGGGNMGMSREGSLQGGGSSGALKSRVLDVSIEKGAGASPTTTTTTTILPVSGSRPPPPPKPQKLRGAPELVDSTTRWKNGGDGSVARDVGNGGSTGGGVGAGGSGSPLIDDPDEWQRNFAQRYPTLSGFEMVETVVGVGSSVSTTKSR